MTRLRCLALCLVVASAVRVHEFVALAPATAGAVAGPATLEWLELAYDTEAASVADVAAAFKTLDAAQPSPVDQWLGVSTNAPQHSRFRAYAASPRFRASRRSFW